MKTTIDIADPLFAEARRYAEEHGMTLRAVVEQGLRSVLVERAPRTPFRLRKATFGGEGLQARAQSENWDTLREWANDRMPLA
jgi:hypothetical protein